MTGENSLIQQIQFERPLFARQSARISVDRDKPKDMVPEMESYSLDKADFTKSWSFRQNRISDVFSVVMRFLTQTLRRPICS